jgi:hypothetical protein
VKEVPIPRTAKTTQDIEKVLGHEISSADAEEMSNTSRDSEYLASVMPSTISAQALVPPEGVWYHISRTHAGNLPVYLEYNNAGGVWTEIRKVSGNAGALRNDLKKALDLNKKDIWVKNAANAVVIKGNWRHQVNDLLRETF